MLTISVALWNPDPAMLEAFLRSLRKTAPEMSQLIVVDNGSADKAYRRLLKEVYGGATATTIDVIENAENLGFGRAHNQALERASGRYFAVVNDDVEWFETWTTPMIRILDGYDGVGQVGMRNGAYNVFDPLGNTEMAADCAAPEYVEGSCFMMRTATAKERGLFDERYEIGYFEDADLSLRLRKAGYRLSNVDVRWIHHRGRTAEAAKTIDMKKIASKNRHEFEERWYGYLLTRSFEETVDPNAYREMQKELLTKRREVAEKDIQMAEKDRRIADILNSWSWRMTAPLRRGLEFLKR